MKITIAKVRVLRKRPDSNVPCDKELVDDDSKFQEEVIQNISCIPVYWKQRDLSQKVCQSKSSLWIADYFIQDYKDILNSYTTPCDQMEVSSKFDREEENESDNPRIMFVYEEMDYEEIQNTEGFDLESFVIYFHIYI